jgi:hypothetical protein
MMASHSTTFAKAKDYIVEALAVRLNPKEAHEHPERYEIHLAPR